MYPILPSEHLVENKICRKSGASFPITDTDIEFYEKISPIFGGKKYLIPPPTLCPDSRQQRRLTFRNERKLYKRKCGATGKEMVSIYSPDKPYTVYHQDYWWSDKWDPMDHGREFDFGRGAMEQYKKLFEEIPHLGILSFATENAEYNNHV
jgi:hypothetical protein